MPVHRPRMPKTRRQAFLKVDLRLQEWLRSIGARESLADGFKKSPGNHWDIDCPEFYVETNLGILRVLPACTHHHYSYTIYMSWAPNVREVNAGVLGASRNGKCNLHLDGTDSPEHVIEYVQRLLAPYLVGGA